MTWLLWRGARGLGPASEFDTRFRERAVRIVVAALGMGAVLYLAIVLTGPVFAVPGLRYGALGALVLLGIFAYALFGRVSGAFTISDITRALRRRT